MLSGRNAQCFRAKAGGQLPTVERFLTIRARTPISLTEHLSLRH
jgi:hypothetical protein